MDLIETEPIAQERTAFSDLSSQRLNRQVFDFMNAGIETIRPAAFLEASRSVQPFRFGHDHILSRPTREPIPRSMREGPLVGERSQETGEREQIKWQLRRRHMRRTARHIAWSRRHFDT